MSNNFQLINKVFKSNKVLAWNGAIYLLISFIFILLLPYNTTKVLGINSLIKPLKFSLSIWMYFWSMAVVAPKLHNAKIVKRFVFLAIFTMAFEQVIITIQAFRGTLSHFNDKTIIESILFSLMGVFITVLTFYTLHFANKLRKQQDQMNRVVKRSFIFGLYIFIFGSLLGGVMGALNTHTIGAEMGEKGLLLVNWSVNHGDLRIAHFVGIHALQIIPILGYVFSRKENQQTATKMIQILSYSYLLVVVFFFIQALLGYSII